MGMEEQVRPDCSDGMSKGAASRGGADGGSDTLTHPDGTRRTFYEGTDERGEYLLTEHVEVQTGLLSGPHCTRI